MLSALFDIADFLLAILGWIIIGQVILSWLFAFGVLNTSSQGLRSFVEALDRITAPMYRPIRRLLILIQILRMLLDGAQSSLTYSTA